MSDGEKPSFTRAENRLGINDKSIQHHADKSAEYKCFGGWLNEDKEQLDIKTIEEDVLKELPKLEKLEQEIKELEKKDNKSEEEKNELAQKETAYKKELTAAKEATCANIRQQLKKNELEITDLDSKRNIRQRM
ncbi:7583_t:CDS:2 [Ambispora gerdemannii]|uniref:7583_t:CDS:1 n=1 Tax=Ambispora gerdemannii TaxID=144530 RepID=A0A9N8ZUH2_9GLOM|nr:7583_t:CDS:2 [Ambispora gerdemannii]